MFNPHDTMEETFPYVPQQLMLTMRRHVDKQLVRYVQEWRTVEQWPSCGTKDLEIITQLVFNRGYARGQVETAFHTFVKERRLAFANELQRQNVIEKKKMEAIFTYQVEFHLCGVRGLQLGTADWYIMDNEDADFNNDQVQKLTEVMSVPPDELEAVKETI